jgi:hypothetical protein
MKRLTEAYERFETGLISSTMPIISHSIVLGSFLAISFRVKDWFSGPQIILVQKMRVEFFGFMCL